MTAAGCAILDGQNRTSGFFSRTRRRVFVFPLATTDPTRDFWPAGYDGASASPDFGNGAITGAFSYAFASIARSNSSQATTCADGDCPGQSLELGPLQVSTPIRVFYALGPGVAQVDTFSWTNFAAGFGDTVSIGATHKIRELWDIDGGVDESATDYAYGGYAGLATGGGMGMGAASGAARIGSTITVTRWGSAGPWYMVGGRSTSNWWLSGTRFKYPYDSASTIQVTAGRLTYPKGWEAVKGVIGQRMLSP